jgi:hypothetical protein
MGLVVKMHDGAGRAPSESLVAPGDLDSRRLRSKGVGVETKLGYVSMLSL